MFRFVEEQDLIKLNIQDKVFLIMIGQKLTLNVLKMTEIDEIMNEITPFVESTTIKRKDFLSRTG